MATKRHDGGETAVAREPSKSTPTAASTTLPAHEKAAPQLSVPAAAALEKLTAWLTQQSGLVIAFSGGMDSGFLALAAHRVHPDNTLAAFADHELLAAFDRERAADLARKFGLDLRTVQVTLLTDAAVRANPPDRCYWCKRVIVRALAQVVPPGWAVAEGSQTDDDGDFRPGRRALDEAGVVSPLRDAGFNKALIGEVLQAWGAAEFIAPARPCIATRFASHVLLSEAGIQRVFTAESSLANIGLAHLRVRDHGDLARIEVAPGDIDVVLRHRVEIVARLVDLGYRHVTLDLAGYRRGSMNQP